MSTNEEISKVNDPNRPDGSETPEAEAKVSTTAPEPDSSSRHRNHSKSNPLTSLGSLSDSRPQVGDIESAENAGSRSRWVDWDTHELLQMISELEDERRWARLREGVWIALLFHFALILALAFLPRYVFLRQPQIIDPFDAIKERKDLTYLDMPSDALKNLQPKTTTKTVPEKQPQLDKKTLEDIKKSVPAEKQPETETQPEQQTTTPAPTQPIQQTPQAETPRPSAVPAKPNFAMNSMNSADQMREAMKNSMRGGQGSSSGNLGGGSGLSMHPGAGSGGVEVLSDTQGVDFSGWLQRWHRETEKTWDPLIPDEVNAPILKKGQVLIRFKVLPNGRLMEGSMVLEGRSGDVALDRAAWGALTGSNYPPLPKDFHGPYLELRALFMYNMGSR
jgi:outer membrane biosynthesis protein TonB